MRDSIPIQPAHIEDIVRAIVELPGVSDSAGAQMVLSSIRERWPWIRHLFADGADDRGRLMDKAASLGFVIEVVRCIADEPGFKTLPRRWGIERTFGWMMR